MKERPPVGKGTPEAGWARRELGGASKAGASGGIEGAWASWVTSRTEL